MVLTVIAAAASEADSEIIWLVIGLIAVALLIWGLVKRLLKMAVLFGLIAAGAWYFYLS